MNKRLNVLCFITDQQRADHLGCMGNTIVKTPNIDALAENGVVFDRAYVANPLCMPARASLFTGRTPRGHGVRSNGIPLSKDIPTMPEALRQAGYRTHSIGKLHLNNYNRPKGFKNMEIGPQDFPEANHFWNTGITDRIQTPYYGFETVDLVDGHTSWAFGDYITWLEKEHPGARELLYSENALENRTGLSECYKMAIPEELHYNRYISNKTIEFLEDSKEEDKPFFLWCSFPDPHHPFGVPDPWYSMYDPVDIPLPKARCEEELDKLPPFYRRIYEEGGPVVSGLYGKSKVTDSILREMIALNYAMISFVDNEVGRVMSKLRELNMLEDTVVVFLSDHGDMMGDHHMIRKGPFQFEGLLRIPYIWSCPGRFASGLRTNGIASQIDFTPTILDLCNVPIPEGKTPYEPEAPNMVEPWPGKSLKLQLEGKVEKVNDYAIVENDEDYLGLRIRTFITDRYKLTIYAGKPYGELFDLKEDPMELNNLWSEPDYQALKASLKCQMLDAYILQDNALPRRLSHS